MFGQSRTTSLGSFLCRLTVLIRPRHLQPTRAALSGVTSPSNVTQGKGIGNTRVVQLPPLLQQINCIARVKCLLKTHRCGPKASLGGLVLAPVAYSLHSGELLHRVAASFQGQVKAVNRPPRSFLSPPSPSAPAAVTGPSTARRRSNPPPWRRRAAAVTHFPTAEHCAAPGAGLPCAASALPRRPLHGRNSGKALLS